MEKGQFWGNYGLFALFRSSLPIINCCLSNYRNATLDQIIEMGKSLMNDVPIQKMLWAPGGESSV
jgi:hypothetical protein